MSAIYIPTIKRDKKRIIQKTGSVPVAVICFDVIMIGGENRICEKIGKFYEKIYERFFKWVNNDFEKYTRRCYEEDVDTRKRYRYAPIELKYVMNYEVAEEKYLVVDTEITLVKGRDNVAKKRLKHIWNLKNGNLHIQRRKAEKCGKK
ncbi:MAG: hypothetical protein IKU48_00845 [Clostridia bacterium]|nr:hypothetical protein [Clostridia bacterium]